MLSSCCFLVENGTRSWRSLESQGESWSEEKF